MALWICYQTLERATAQQTNKQKISMIRVFIVLEWDCSVSNVQTHKLLKSEWMSFGWKRIYIKKKMVYVVNAWRIFHNLNRQCIACFEDVCALSVYVKRFEVCGWETKTKPIHMLTSQKTSYFMMIITPFNILCYALPLHKFQIHPVNALLKGNLFIFKMQFVQLCVFFFILCAAKTKKKDFLHK